MIWDEARIVAQRERMADLVRAEASERQLAIPGRAPRTGRRAFALAWLGGRMVCWGWWLQARSGAAEA